MAQTEIRKTIEKLKIISEILKKKEIHKIHYLINEDLNIFEILEFLKKDLNISHKVKNFPIGRSFSFPSVDISKAFLLENGFEKKKEIIWVGNRTEDRKSEIIQQDFILGEQNDNLLIIRFEKFSYEENDDIKTDEVISFHYGEWRPGCYDYLPIFYANL